MAIKVREFRKLAGPLAEDAAAQVVEKLEPSSDLGEFAVELFGVESLCERLVGEDEIDRLSNLKDNLFAPALQRLDSIIAGASSGNDDDPGAMTKPFTTFKDALLGAGYAIDADHQTITPGGGGLYALCRRRLELRQQRDLLRDAVARGAQEYKTALERFDAASDEMRDRITSQAEAGLSRTWSGLLIACAACGGLLLLLGTIIARTIRRQIVAIQRTTAELAHSNAQMAAIHETSLDAIIVMDSDGRIVEFSQSAQRALGFARPDVLGKDLADTIMPARFRERHRQGLMTYLTTGQSAILNRRVEVAVLRADGSEFPAELTVARADVEGRPLFTAFIRDLSDQKRAESEREQLHNRLLSASRQAGMAEVATGVLHNVGNVLNSVNVSASVVAERLRKSEIASLQKASDMLREHEHDLPQYLSADQRGKHLPAFLIEVASYLADEQKELLAEMESVGRGLDHIKHIVGAQQSHAKRGGGVLLQRVRPAELMEVALEMQRESFQRHQVTIERRFAELPEMPLDKHRTLQILVNLLANAKDAVREGRRSDRRITVALETGEAALGAGGAMLPVVRFVIEDNGIGIAAENLAKVFGHGFTTRSEGHGFGLHSAANAAREMGGNLAAASDGPGLGATFSLELPIKRHESLEPTGATRGTGGNRL
jgi:PAS domain S-box-containing protein